MPITAAKIVIMVLLFLILASLATSLFFLLRDSGKTKRSVNALTVRIALSLSLFALLWLAWAEGWIIPNLEGAL